jgi:hypothetical protein
MALIKFYLNFKNQIFKLFVVKMVHNCAHLIPLERDHDGLVLSGLRVPPGVVAESAPETAPFGAKFIILIKMNLPRAALYVEGVFGQNDPLEKFGNFFFEIEKSIPEGRSPHTLQQGVHDVGAIADGHSAPEGTLQKHLDEQAMVLRVLASGNGKEY